MTPLSTCRDDTLFFSPKDGTDTINRQGMVATLTGMAHYIEQDFLRWTSFDKSARLASHSRDGVIELMPIADDTTYTFKFVNGHPKNTACGLSTVMAFDATAKLMRNLQGNPDTAALRLNVHSSTAEAVRGADIVTTITAGMLVAGTHLNAVGGDCPGKTEIHPDVLRAAKVFVEYEPQTRAEGDLQQMPPDFAVTELWQVLSGQKTGRDHAGQITMFDSVGFALEDFSALRYLNDSARSLRLGESIPLIPRLDDPKNLYQLVRPSTASAPGKRIPSEKTGRPIVMAREKQTALA